jgi:hypothetical protein
MCAVTISTSTVRTICDFPIGVQSEHYTLAHTAVYSYMVVSTVATAAGAAAADATATTIPLLLLLLLLLLLY